MLPRPEFRALRFAALALLAAGKSVGSDAAAPISPRTSGTPFFSVWRAEDYRASPINWRVLQHPRTGFIYVANNFGVLEFDGATWRLIPLPRGGAARALVVDTAGTLWVGGTGELCTLEPDPQTGVLRFVDQAPRVPPPVAGGPAFDAAESESDSADSNDPYRVGVVGRALATSEGVYFRLPDRIVRLAPQSPPKAWPSSQTVNSLLEIDRAVYVAGPTRGFQRLHEDGFETLAPGASGFVIFAAQKSAEPVAGASWRLLTSRGPVRWAGPGAPLSPPSEQAAAVFRNEQALAGAFLPDGRVVYATARIGLLVFDAQDQLIQTIDRTNGLPADRVNDLWVDRDGGVWLAMHFALARVQLDSPFANHGAAQGLEGGPREILRAGDRLYVTHGEGLAWRDDATGKFHAVPGFRSGTNQVAVVGDRLIATGTGIYAVPREGAATRLRATLHYGLHGLAQPAGSLLVSAINGVAWWPSPDGAEQRENLPLPAGANQFLDAHDGFIWTVLRTDEIWRIDARGGAGAKSPGRRYVPADGIAAARRRDGLRVLRIGRDIIAASTRWLLRYDAKTDRFVPETRLGAFDAGRGPAAACEAPDGAWFYFAGENARLLRLRVAGDTWTTDVFAAHALGDLAINALYYDAPTRALWIAGQGTLLSFSPEAAVAQPPGPLRAVVHDLADARGQVLRAFSAAGSRTPLALGAGQTALRFAFAAPAFAPDYRGQNVMRFRTRLDGLEREWTAWSADTRRDFTNLPPGPMTFQVEARDIAGRVSEPAVLAFTLAAPWWRTPWAYAGYVTVGLATIGGAVKLRTRALRRKNEQLEGVVAARTAELRERNAELARLNQLELDEKISAKLGEEKARLETLRYQLNPHFLFNALNAFPGLVAQQPDAAGKMAISLGDFCRRMLAQHGEEKQRVGDEFAMLQAYLDVEKIRWGDSLEIEIRADPAALDAQVPAFLLLPLVENAIKHGGATTPGVLRVRLVVARNVDGLAFEIANTGRWSERPASGVVSTSIGLENLHRRLARYYPGAHTLSIGQDGDWVVARLNLLPPDEA